MSHRMEYDPSVKDLGLKGNRWFVRTDIGGKDVVMDIGPSDSTFRAHLETGLDIYVWPMATTSRDRYSSWYSRILSHFEKSSTRDPFILDIGCSFGIAVKGLEEFLEQQGYSPQTMGIDINLKLLKRSVKENNIKNVMLGEAQYLPIADSSVDLAICSHTIVLFPTEERNQCLMEFNRVLSHNGALILDIDIEGKSQSLFLTKENINRLASLSNGFTSLTHEHLSSLE